MLGLLTRHKWLVAASALILALIALRLAARPRATRGPLCR
jgi:hypothetical protein